ncbi:MAG: single-stranded DNA-binding protein [Saprospiraceae bacterium]|nr:single-stranded DNA-binding protein [Saprospiraceae bacterium]MDW8230045.1 single-stranded DNA-binding protein [Saprospiraceae bacterium]
MINKVTLIGNLGGDPEVRRLEGGVAVARFSLATNENYQDKDGNWQTQTEWHNVVAWRGLAERVERLLKKGMLVYVEGKISYRKYTPQDGQERYVTDIVANSIRILEKRESSGDARFPPAENMPATPAAPPPTATDAPQGGDDLPF